MKSLFLYLLFALVTASAHAQTDRGKLIEESNALYESEDYAKSLELLLQAFELEDGDDGEYYDAACMYALTGEVEKAMQSLTLAVDKGWRNWRWPRSDKDLKSIRGRSDFQALMDRTRELQEADFIAKGYDMELVRQLEDIYIRDQTLRHYYVKSEEEFGQGSEENQYLMSMMINQDRENEAAIEEIIETHGWPGIDKVGGRANAAVWLVIQHAPMETQEKYLPLLKESVVAGNSTPRHLAMLEDRLLLAQGKKQIYGSQLESTDDGGWRLSPLVDPEHVDKRRAEVGLGPLKDYTRRWNIEFDVEQKP